MPRQLKNVIVTHVSYVDKAANKHKFLLVKSADKKPVFEVSVKPVIKTDDPQKLVYGIVYEPNVVDSQGDFMTANDIEKAAHGFMENYQLIDKQHDFTTHAGQVVESYIAPADMTIGDQTVTKGTWVLVTKATDDIWDAIQKGEFTGYSLAGQAEVVQKATQENYEKNLPMGQVQLAMQALNNAVNGINWSDGQFADNADKLQAVLQEADEFKAVVQSISGSESTTKSLVKQIKSWFKPKESEDEMELEEVKKAVTEALKPMNDRIEKLEKDQKTAGPGNNEQQEDVPQALITKAVQEAVKPMSDRIDQLEKARKSNHLSDVDVTKNADQYKVPAYVDAAFPMDK